MSAEGSGRDDSSARAGGPPERTLERFARRLARAGGPGTSRGAEWLDAAGERLTPRTAVRRGLSVAALAALPLGADATLAAADDYCVQQCVEDTTNAQDRAMKRCVSNQDVPLLPNGELNWTGFEEVTDGAVYDFAAVDLGYNAMRLQMCFLNSRLDHVAANNACFGPQCGNGAKYPPPGTGTGAPCAGGQGHVDASGGCCKAPDVLDVNGGCCESPDFLCPSTGACTTPAATVCSCGCFTIAAPATCETYCGPGG